MSRFDKLQTGFMGAIVKDPMGAVIACERLEKIVWPVRAHRLIGLLGFVTGIGQIMVQYPRGDLISKNRL